MSRLQELWERWVRACTRPIDGRPLALVRVLVPLMIAIDLLQMVSKGMVTTFFRPQELGGLIKISESDYVGWLLLNPEWGGQVGVWVTIVSMLLVSIGLFTRPALVVGLVSYAMLEDINGMCDRGIDRALRTVLLLLLFSGVHKVWALDHRGEKASKTVSAWAEGLVVWLLVLIYLSAGLGKPMSNPDWLMWSDYPPLYRIFVDPMASYLDAVAIMPAMPLWNFLSWMTILVEGTAFLAFTRFKPWWALCCAPIHIGIAMTMKLGMFSFGMLSLYPVLFAPWISAWLQRREQRS